MVVTKAEEEQTAVAQAVLVAVVLVAPALELLEVLARRILAVVAALEETALDQARLAVQASSSSLTLPHKNLVVVLSQQVAATSFTHSRPLEHWLQLRLLQRHI